MHAVLGGQFVSVFSLMRDGKALAERLRWLDTLGPGSEVLQAARTVIQPYLQLVRGDERCRFTGLRLVDIWRYFRHTWASPYKSVPGRSMMILVRDAAAPCHPVMGIAALSSASVAMTARDDAIGWTTVEVLKEIRDKPSTRWAKWLLRITDEAIAERYKLDFFEDELLRPADLKRPTPTVIAALEEDGRTRREEHHRFMQSADYKKVETAATLGDNHWESQARSPLFRSKRALELAQLLRVRAVLMRSWGKRPSKEGLLRLIEDRDGRDAVGRIVRKAKAERVGTVIGDLTVCGAVSPYNEVLGGKLVAMLATSPQVVSAYRKRYSRLPSVIASSMAGRAVTRPADLVFIGTTSLYGQRPCQYDRIAFPPDLCRTDAPATQRYEYLGRTKGLGTLHFGEQTIAALSLVLSQSKNGQRVNSVFGEGVNPRLRKTRDGLNALGLPAEELLTHGNPRLVYGVRLIHNVREYLLGMQSRPRYIVSQDDPRGTTERLGIWWLERWVLPRIKRNEIIERVAQHTLVHPIRHGARVKLPLADTGQILLFE